LTDVKSGKELVEKAFAYMTNLSKECRKGLTAKFEQVHKGIPFESVEPTIRQEIETWFSERDRNITVRHEKSGSGRPGEVLITYTATNKDAHFKFHVDSLFATAGPAGNAPSYLKSMSVYVDKREFTK
jgi:hypothetical protein